MLYSNISIRYRMSTCIAKIAATIPTLQGAKLDKSAVLETALRYLQFIRTYCKNIQLIDDAYLTRYASKSEIRGRKTKKAKSAAKTPKGSTSVPLAPTEKLKAADTLITAELLPFETELDLSSTGNSVIDEKMSKEINDLLNEIFQNNDVVSDHNTFLDDVAFLNIE
ncbi:uncharacterized protein LOC129599144 isoform X2 [Paramacrobiotus metropolitanus]|uniref:uncharacterized protein LOC129599144 isoform X2 n=1 Tax=Paramacrobiotus metropolitanus TaxID=2943436 RepID=UPI002445A21D|nr:uncharacterized protein LOC129599144 isoform X2 [Paramacrobiotus metropolitanus]